MVNFRASQRSVLQVREQRSTENSPQMTGLVEILVGAAGFEPTMAVSKTAALPLGYAPAFYENLFGARLLRSDPWQVN